MVIHQSSANFLSPLQIIFILILIQVILVCGTARKVGIEKNNDQDITKQPIQRIIDPQLSWMVFVKNSNRQINRHRIKNGSGRKKLGTLSVPATPCPRGPQGPTSPPGPFGANEPKEVLLNEFRELIKEVVEKRIESMDPSTETSVLDNVDEKRSNRINLDSAVNLPKVSVRFFSRLSAPVVMQKTSLHVRRLKMQSKHGKQIL